MILFNSGLKSIFHLILFVNFLLDVIFSAIGGLIWVAALTTWIIIFQTHRASWGETADRISFIIPTGIP